MTAGEFVKQMFWFGCHIHIHTIVIWAENAWAIGFQVDPWELKAANENWR